MKSIDRMNVVIMHGDNDLRILMPHCNDQVTLNEVSMNDYTALHKLHDVDYYKVHFAMMRYILNYIRGVVAVQCLYAKCLFYEKIKKMETKKK